MLGRPCPCLPPLAERSARSIYRRKGLSLQFLRRSRPPVGSTAMASVPGSGQSRHPWPGKRARDSRATPLRQSVCVAMQKKAAAAAAAANTGLLVATPHVCRHAMSYQSVLEHRTAYHPRHPHPFLPSSPSLPRTLLPTKEAASDSGGVMGRCGACQDGVLHASQPAASQRAQAPTAMQVVVRAGSLVSLPTQPYLTLPPTPISAQGKVDRQPQRREPSG